MKNIDPVKRQLRYLIAKSMDGQITDDEVKTLNRLISSSEDMQKYYRQCIRLHIVLRDVCELGMVDLSYEPLMDNRFWEQLAEYENKAPIVDIPGQREEREVVQSVVYEKAPRHISMLNLYVAIVSLAVLIFLVLIVKFTPEKKYSVDVATLTGSLDVKWQDEHGTYAKGDRLFTDEMISLKRGIIHVRTDRGVDIIVEGPADLELRANADIYLHSGRLSALVHPQGMGFTVDTDHARVVDLGTEFGVSVSDEGYTELHVFEGKTVLYSQETTQSSTVITNMAQRVTPSGHVEAIANRPQNFIRQEEFNTRMLAESGSAYHRWLAYSYQLRRDPDLVAYYTFEKSPDSPGLLKNLAGETAGDCDGYLISKNDGALPNWVPGRWPQKTALEFDRSQQQMVEIENDPRLNLSGPLTLSAWIKCPEIFDGGGGMIVSNRTTDIVNYQMSLGMGVGEVLKDKIAFARYVFQKESNNNGRPIIQSDQLPQLNGSWHHVVITHDNEIVRYYFDGRLFSSQPYPFQDSPVEMNFQIGSAKGKEARMFTGLLDEIAVFKRLLSEREIQAMYESGRP